MAENNSVLVIAVLAVIASLAAAGFSYYAMSQGPKVSGYLSNVDTGTASLTVDTVMEIEFTDDAIAWATGRVDTGAVRAVLDSEGNKVNGSAWTAESTGLTLENKGNVKGDITLSATKTAATLIGGTSPSYQWKVTSANCVDTYVTAYENANSSAVVCNDFNFADGSDTLRVDVKVVVPQDAPIGAKSDTITATAA